MPIVYEDTLVEFEVVPIVKGVGEVTVCAPSANNDRGTAIRMLGMSGLRER